MISCPRCGFQQPKDQYCAKCGVDMTDYRPPSNGILKPLALWLKPIIVFVIILAGLSFILKNLNKRLNLKIDIISESDEIEKTILGTQASQMNQKESTLDLQNENNSPATAKENSIHGMENKVQNIPDIEPAAQFDPKNQETSEEKNMIVQEHSIQVSLVELFIPENKRDLKKLFSSTNDPQILNSFFTESTIVKDKPVPLYFEDELLIYEINLQLKKNLGADKKTNLILTIEGTQKTKLAIEDSYEFFKKESVITPSEYSILLIESIRSKKLPLTSLILNSLLRSEDFLSQKSELAFLIKTDEAK